MPGATWHPEKKEVQSLVSQDCGTAARRCRWAGLRGKRPFRKEMGFDVDSGLPKLRGGGGGAKIGHCLTPATGGHRHGPGSWADRLCPGSKSLYGRGCLKPPGRGS